MSDSPLDETGDKLLGGDIDLEEELGSDAFMAQEYDDRPPQVSDNTVARLQTLVNADGTLREILKAKKSDFVRNLIYLDGKKFDFTGRGYLRPIYDGNFKRILLKTARQVEKCLAETDYIELSNGARKKACEVTVGDRILGFDHRGRCLVDTVTGSESNGVKPCLLITLESGRSATVTHNHPLRARCGWVRADRLLAGERIAALRERGEKGGAEAHGWADSPDLVWEKIVSVQNAGERPTWAIETGSRTFVANGIVNHNTTFLANNLTITSVVIPYNKSLYVSPSHTQTRQFSNEKLRPAIERSPLISRYFQDSSVSTQVFEKGFTNGAYIFLRSAFRSADRTRGISARVLCLAGHTLVFLESGAVCTLASLAERAGLGERVLSFNEGTGAIEYKEIDRIVISGGKPMKKLKTKSGYELELTHDHKVLTWEGWKEAQDLKIGDMVIEPSHLPSAGKGTSDVDADDALIVSMLLGDGTHAKFSRTSFHTTNNVLVDAFTGALRRKGAEFSIGGYNRENTLSGKNIVEFQVRIYGGKEGYKRKLREMGIIGQRTADKSVTFFEKLDKRDVVVAALNGFIATDGYVSAAHRPENKSSPISVEIGYVTTSRQLAHQVSFLFRKLGVYCHIRHRQHDNGISKRVQYIVNVRDLENAEKVAAFLEPPGKEEAVEKLRQVIELSRSARKTNLVPLTNSTLLDMIAAKGKTLSGFRGGFASNLARNESYTTAAKVRAVAGYINDDELLKKVSPDIIWQPITSIEEAQPCTTYDITVRDNHNFFANGVLVHNCLDELQDFLTTEIPVIMECTSHFPDASNLMAGTPKSHDNPIEVYWQATTQGEWLVPCPHCGKWNFLDENNIGPTDWYVSKRLPPGPICKKCQKPINPATGQWVEFYPDNMIKGFRVPQLMVPWICGLHEQWLKLLWKRDNYPFGQFNNEVLGLSYDSASKPITRDELMEACHDYGLWNLSTPEGIRIAQAEAKKWSLTAGVDWGEGNDGSEKSPSGKIRNASYTVIAIGAYITQKHWKLFYAKRFEGREIDPDFVVREITRICQLLGVKLIGTDWGHGWGVNNILMRTFGPNRVAQFQYMPKLRQRMKWDAIGYRYQLQRNFIMSELFFDMKHALIQFPRWRDFEPFAKDILAIYAEYNEYRREIKFDHRPSDPDDFFHSLNLAKLMSDIMTGKSRRYTIDAVQVEGPVG